MKQHWKAYIKPILIGWAAGLAVSQALKWLPPGAQTFAAALLAGTAVSYAIGSLISLRSQFRNVRELNNQLVRSLEELRKFKALIKLEDIAAREREGFTRPGDWLN